MKVDKCISCFKALANEKRLRILLLLQEKPHCVNEIVEKLKYPQSLISIHLSILRKVELVKCEKKGKRVYYKIVSKDLTKLLELIQRIY